ncbi:MAG: hypothetical protein U0235_06470 [Polyangiaceae bacterium]
MRSAAALLVSLGLFACGGGATAEAPGVKSPTDATSTTQSTQATDFSGRDTDGKTVRLSDYLGKQVVLLDFWST